MIEKFLRVGMFLTFLGHGVCALGGKVSWLPYFTVFGFSDIVVLKLLYIIGFVDIIVVVSILIKPLKLIVLWAFSTAVMRPVVRQPIWDFVERGSNWMVPLSFNIKNRNLNILIV